MSLTYLPRRVLQCFLGPCFHHRHQLVFNWLLVLHLLYGDRANLKALARHGPAHLAYQWYRRLLCAAYWCTKTLLWWFADQALQAFPPPEDGILYLVGNSTLKGKRGPQHPLAQKTRLSQHHPYVFGFRIVILMAQWETYRIPVDFALVRRTDDPAYQTENALFRHMLQVFRRPAWCQELIVTADAAYASRANLELIQTLGYGYVMALPGPGSSPMGRRSKPLSRICLAGSIPRFGCPRSTRNIVCVGWEGRMAFMSPIPTCLETHRDVAGARPPGEDRLLTIHSESAPKS